MPEWTHVGKVLAFLGVLLLLLGGLFIAIGKLPNAGGLGWFGRLPGDIFIKREHFTFYFPLVTSLVVSVVLSLLFYVIATFLRR